MKITEIGGEEEKRYRVFFSTLEYRTLLECSADVQFRHAQRLGAQSLRRGEVVELTYDQFKRADTPYGEIWVIEVEGKDTTDRDQSGKKREVWVPDDLADSIRKNAGRHWGTDYQFFPMSEGTLQNRMEATREAAATKTGNERYLRVSFHDYRRYFANHYLFRHELDAEIVRQLGGWADARSMLEYLKLPDDILAHHLGEKNLLNTAADLDPGVVGEQSVAPAINNIQDQINGSSHQKQHEIVTKLQSLVENIEGVQLTTSQVLPSDRSNSGDSTSLQSSLETILNNEESSPKSRTLAGSIASLIKYYGALTGLRAKREREWMRDDPDLVDPATPYGAASLLGASLLGGVMIAFMLAMGHSLGVMILLTAIAGAVAMITEQADVTPSANNTAAS